jgi:two-component system sensor histidine kinase KdpD
MRWPVPSLGLKSEPPPFWAGLLAAFAATALATLLIFPLKSSAPALSLGVVFIPGVLLISSIWGLRLGLLTALLGALAFNWFHIPPTGRFTIADNRDLVALVVFAIAALASGTLADFARARVAEADEQRQEARRALAELEALSRERDRMQAEVIEAEALRRSDELKTALLRSVSHDLRTPLTAVIAAGSALDSPTLTAAERHELSEAIVEEGQRLSRLVENLLDVSRLESGKAEPHRETIDVAEVLEVARDSVRQGRELVAIEVEPGLPGLRADPAQLERAFANLFENAIRHGRERPVLASSRLVGERLDLRVVDQGPGIPEADWERIFEPFYRGGQGGSAGAGSGLGLAIAKGFVEANGGRISLESLPGQGTSFIVSFSLPDR